jgi:hypothetical protein
MKSEKKHRALQLSLQGPDVSDVSYLQELLDCPAHIPQADLCELQRLERALAIAKSDFEAVHEQILEMLMFGFRGDGGPLAARLDRGRVVVEDVTPLNPFDLDGPGRYAQ